MGATIERAISWAVSIAQDDNYRYSQTDRWGIHSRSTPPYYYDCSSFVADAFTRASGKDFTQNYTTYTGNMLPYFTNNGFVDVTATGVIQRGDVLLTHNEDRQHTCIYTGTTQVNNTQGVAKQCVEALNTASGIVYNYNDFNHYEHILRYVEATPTEWKVKKIGDFVRGSDESINNAWLVKGVLEQHGFNINAITAVVASMDAESGLNPWRWQNDNVLNSYDDYTIQNSHAYGLVQFDPASKYIDNAVGVSGYGPNFNDRVGRNTDGHAQCLVIATDSINQWYTRSWAPIQYRKTFEEFKVMTNLHDAVGAWVWCYEYPSSIEQAVESRYTLALYWYEVLTGLPPTPPTPTTKRKLPIWLLKQTINKNTKGTFQL